MVEPKTHQLATARYLCSSRTVALLIVGGPRVYCEVLQAVAHRPDDVTLWRAQLIPRVKVSARTALTFTRARGAIPTIFVCRRHAARASLPPAP